MLCGGAANGCTRKEIVQMSDDSRVLIVDDDEKFLSSIKYALRTQPYEIWTTADPQRALQIIHHNDVAVVVSDVYFENANGLDLLQKIRDEKRHLPVIVISAFATSSMAIKAMNLGAYEFLPKPFDLEKFKIVLSDATKVYDFSKKVGLPTEQAPPEDMEGEVLVGKSHAIIEISKKIGQVAGSDVPVLVQGETGTGKELVARAIHGNSKRQKNLVMAINCAAIPETLLESELFGYERGAFTGAFHSKPGKVERADGSTLFLDEIGDLSPALQAKLLRFLETGEFERVGATKPTKVDVRIISATNVNLKKAVQEGRFRDDLYYRLNVVNIQIPPLRERKEDIPLLVRYILRRTARDNPRRTKDLTDAALDKLINYYWPGNVRELFNVLQRAVVLSRGRLITAKEILLDIDMEKTPVRPDADTLHHLVHRYLARTDNAHRKVIETVERVLIDEAMRVAGGNKSEAARLLGISRNTLRERLSYYKTKITSRLYSPCGILRK